MADQRAYTFTLKADPAVLFTTHAAVNAGVAEALDFYATLRGGLSAQIAIVDDAIARRDRMIVLTRCWFVPESNDTIALAHAIATPTPERLRAILEADGLAPPDIDAWLAAVRSVMLAEKREDAVWIDRRAAFDASGLTQEAIVDVLLEPKVFGNPYLLDGEREAAKDLIQVAGMWLSRRLGAGEKADFRQLAAGYTAIAEAIETLSVPCSGEAFCAAVAATLGVTPTAIESWFVAPGHPLLRNRDTAPLVREVIAAWKPEAERYGTYTKTRDGWMRAGTFTRSGPPPVYVPRENGPLFTSDGVRFFDADMNAAIGLAMIPILDRDWPLAVPYIPCEPSGLPIAERVKGSPWIAARTALLERADATRNAWRLPDETWAPTSAFWAAARARIAVTLVKRVAG